MSYDLTVWYAPRLRSFDAAMARLERNARPGPRDRARLSELVDALRAGPLTDEALSVDPVVDERSMTLGLCLTGAAPSLEALLPTLRQRGMACYDPQEAVVHYADGTSSRDEKTTAGVHEGVPICLAELQQTPPLPESERLDAMDALLQFALADSPDEAAAVRMALPVLLDLFERGEARVSAAARSTAWELCQELARRGRVIALEPELVQRVAALGDEWLASAVRAVLSDVAAS